jgi:tetratricopeptide (TPR) repeat protein
LKPPRRLSRQGWGRGCVCSAGSGSAPRTAGELVAKFVDGGARIGRIEQGFEGDLVFPDSAEYWDTLGQVYEATGETEKALAAYGGALVADPAFEHAARRLEELEK